MTYRVALYAISRQRIATYLPLARAILRRGHDCALYISSPEPPCEEELEGFEDVPLIRATPEDVSNLGAVDVFVSSETAAPWIPGGAVAVAILHSLPDRTILETNYAGWLINNAKISAFDYCVVAARQSEADWQVESYSGHVHQTSRPSSTEGMYIVPGGYPKLEYLSEQLAGATTKDTIIYCPTSTANAVSDVIEYGAEILKRLHEGFPDYRVVFRPYPAKKEPAKDAVVAQCAGLERFSLDTTITGADQMKRCAALVTDKSSAAITFSLCSGRPSVFFQAVADEAYPDGVRDEIIGYQAVGWQGLQTAVEEALSSGKAWQQQIEAVRDTHLHNGLNASDFLAENIETFATRSGLDDWLYVKRK